MVLEKQSVGMIIVGFFVVQVFSSSKTCIHLESSPYGCPKEHPKGQSASNNTVLRNDWDIP